MYIRMSQIHRFLEFSFEKFFFCLDVIFHPQPAFEVGDHSVYCGKKVSNFFAKLVLKVAQCGVD